MAITIKHAKTNAIADWTQPQLTAITQGQPAPLPPAGTTLAQVTLPSDWNADHIITGTPDAGGSNGQVQFNNGGAFGGFGSWDGSTLAVGALVTGTSFNGFLATGNISQWTNDSGYITSAGAPVQSVSNSDGTLTISPTTGAVVASLNLAHANTVTGQWTFNTSTAIFGVAPTFSTMTPGSVLFAGTAGLLSQNNNNFFWDNTNNRLGINKTAAPYAALDVNGNSLTDVAALNLATNSSINLVPVMTSNTSPKGVASCTGGSSSAYLMFNGDLLPVGNFKFNIATIPCVLQYQFANPTIINAYQYWKRINFTSSPNTWTFEGSNNGSSWTVLDTQIGVVDATWQTPLTFALRFSFSNTTPYLYYRMNISVSNNGSSIDCIALKMYGPALTPGIVTDSLGRSGFNNPTPSQAIDIQSGNLQFTPVEPPPPLICALAGAGAGNVNNGDHRYAVAYLNANGHTNLSNWSTTVTVVDLTTNGKVALTNIPISGDPTVTARLIVRTKVGDVNGGYTLTTINDNTTTTFTDNLADASLGAFVGQPSTDPWQQDSYQNTTAGKMYVGSNTLLHFTGDGNTLYFGTRVGNPASTGGGGNIGFGAQCMSRVTTGTDNCAFGINNMIPLTTGQGNMAIGITSMANLTTGNNNCAVGVGALVSITTGTQNVGVATSAGQTNTVGNNNVYIGYNADATANNFSQSIAIGCLARVGASNTMALGSTTAAGFAVDIIAGGTTASAKLHLIKTTEQLRLGYDVSNYFSTTVGSTGSTTFALTGTSPIFTFSQNVVVPDIQATTYHVGTDAGIDATVTYVDTVLGAKVLTFKKGILTAQT